MNILVLKLNSNKINLKTFQVLLKQLKMRVINNKFKDSKIEIRS